MSRLRMTYLALAVLGAILPSVFYGQWLATHGLVIVSEITNWSASGLLTAISWDIAITVVAFFIFVFYEALARKDYLPLVVFPVTLVVGLACGFPLYLFLRSRPLD